MILRMKKFFWAIVACVTLMFGSCTTHKQTSATTEIQAVIHQYPTVADLEVMDKVEAKTVWSFRPFHLGEPSLSLAKGNLIAETLKKVDADVLLEPQFIFARTPYGIRELVVTGFPAKFKNFRKATSDDLKALECGAKPNERKVYNVSENKLFKFLGGK